MILVRGFGQFRQPGEVGFRYEGPVIASFSARWTIRSIAALPIRLLVKNPGHSLMSRFEVRTVAIRSWRKAS